MKQFAIIGLGAFGRRMLEQMSPITDEIILIDIDRDRIERYRDKAKSCFVADALNEAFLQKILPPDIDAAIVDLGGKIEASVMVTNHLKRMNIGEIVVKARSNEHGEVLSMVGATKVIFPDQEAAKRVVPRLATSMLFNFLPISGSLSIAEVRANEKCVGKSLLELNFRKTYGINVIALGNLTLEEFTFIEDPAYIFQEGDILLVVGSEQDIYRFSGQKIGKNSKKKRISDFGSLLR